MIRQGLCLELKPISGNRNDPGTCGYMVDNHMVCHPRCVFINYNWIN